MAEREEQNPVSQDTTLAGSNPGTGSGLPGGSGDVSPGAKDRIHELIDRMREQEADHAKEREGMMAHVSRLEGRLEEVSRRPASTPEDLRFDSVEDELRYEIEQMKRSTALLAAGQKERNDREAFARKLSEALGSRKFGGNDEEARRLVEMRLRETGDVRLAQQEADRLAKRWGTAPTSVPSTPSAPANPTQYAADKARDAASTRAPAPGASASPGAGPKDGKPKTSKELFADAETKLLAALSGSGAGE